MAARGEFSWPYPGNLNGRLRGVSHGRRHGYFFPLATKDEVRAYCRHNGIPQERAATAPLPLWLTKRGVLVRARKS